MNKLLIGCGGSCLGVLLLLAISAAIYGPKVVNWTKTFVTDQIESEQQRQKIAAQWTPPAEGSGDDSWLPIALKTYQRTAIHEELGLPQLGVDQATWSATYENGKRQAKAYWLSADDYRFADLLSNARRASEAGNSKTWLQLGFRAYISWSSPNNQFNMWNLNEWILVVHSTDAEFDTDELIQQLLTANGTVDSTANDIPPPASENQ